MVLNILFKIFFIGVGFREIEEIWDDRNKFFSNLLLKFFV